MQWDPFNVNSDNSSANSYWSKINVLVFMVCHRKQVERSNKSRKISCLVDGIDFDLKFSLVAHYHHRLLAKCPGIKIVWRFLFSKRNIIISINWKHWISSNQKRLRNWTDRFINPVQLRDEIPLFFLMVQNRWQIMKQILLDAKFIYSSTFY